MRTRILSVVLGAASMLAASPVAAKSSSKSGGACSDSREPASGGGEAVRIWIAPLGPSAGKPLRALAVAEESQGAAELQFTGPGGKKETLTTVRRGGPPSSYQGSLASPGPGRYLIELVRDGKTIACRNVEVAARGHRGPPPALAPVGAWTASRSWDRAMENFYAAWIESLFDAPLGANVSFKSLAEAIRDRDRNLLFDYLGLGEDDPKSKTALAATPDCADLPYFLRTYFSWKLGLPIGMRDCDRGTDGRPPRCGDLITNESPFEGTAPKDALSAMKKFLRLLANKVHSGSARTGLGDDATDYYPVKLTRDTLRPGTVFADPYGHVLMLVKWVDQGADTGGMLLAVDGQPDNSVGRKRFWEGTFLYANDVVGAGPGWKRFRPLLRGPDGKLTPLANASLQKDRRFATFSTEQADLDRETFYARMAKLINPKGLDAAAVYRETLDALVEQLQTRVGSVDNGEQYMREHPSPPVPMPDGAKIFETVGPWEDYATPSRDMRLQIAMHVLETLPARIVAHPELFNLGGRDRTAVRAEVEKLHAERIKEKSVEYKRSDGTPQKLTVADVLARKDRLEMAYNPNDCAEVRWGAAEGTPEAASCKRHAPDDQRAKMQTYRAWFHEMKRPAR